MNRQKTVSMTEEEIAKPLDDGRPDLNISPKPPEDVRDTTGLPILVLGQGEYVKTRWWR